MTTTGVGPTCIPRAWPLLIAMLIAAASSAQQLQPGRAAPAPGSESGVVAAPLVLVLDPTADAALSVKGADLVVPSGSVHANSSSACAIKLTGTATLSAVQTSVVGDACFPDGSVVGTVQPSAGVIADPLASLLPTVVDWNAFKASLPLPAGPFGTISATGTYDPGYYPGGLNAASGAVITLNPGSYVFGEQVKVGGTAVVAGAGVTLFLDLDVTLDTGRRSGLVLTPPPLGAPFHGITLFAHRETTGASICKFAGSVELEGVVYVPGGEVIFASGDEIGSIIAGQVNVSGKSGLTITGDGVPPLF